MVGSLSTGCLDLDSEDERGREERYLLGNVYNGITNERIEDYDIAIEFFGRRYPGKVNANGGFELDAVPQNHDYSVFIEAKGFRSFISRNAQFQEELTDDAPTTNPRSFHYDAFLFPADAQVDDVTFRMQLNDSADIPSGSLRLVPTTGSAFLNQPASIAGQVWNNSEDLLARALFTEFEDGEVEVAGKDLVLGVNYALSILNVPGYQLSTGTAFQAGVDTDRTLLLTRLGREPLAVTYVSTIPGNPTPDGSLFLVFNQAIEWDPLGSENFYFEALDDGFGINSDKVDDDDDFNSLRDDEDDDLQEHGTSVELEGNVMRFAWNPDIGLETADSGDVIRTVVYGNLDQLAVRPVGGNASDVATVSDLLNQTSVTVVVQP